MKPYLSRLACVWAAGLIATLLAACAGTAIIANPPKVSLAGIRLVDFNYFEQTFNFTLRINNPNEESITLDNLRFEVELDGQNIAEGGAKGPISLAGLDNTTWDVAAHTETIKLAQLMSKRTANDSSTFRVHGKVHVEGLGVIPFSAENRVPSFSMAIGQKLK